VERRTLLATSLLAPLVDGDRQYCGANCPYKSLTGKKDVCMLFKQTLQYLPNTWVNSKTGSGYEQGANVRCDECHKEIEFKLRE